VLAAVALGGVGVAGRGRQVAGRDRRVAGAAPHDTPARKIARLRAKAARVQAAIDRMNARVGSLVEDYNQVREALARRQLGRRLWAIYTGGAPSTLGQLLGVEDIHQAPVTTRYQEQVVEADRAAIDRVDRLRRQVEALAARLADQAERQRRLQARLAAKRRYHQRLTRRLWRAVAEERRRQEALRRRGGAWAGGAGAPRAPPGGRSPSPEASWAGRTCGGRPAPARTTARAWSWPPTAAPGCGCPGSAGTSGTPAWAA
jgi:hypothetical protein